MDRRTIPIPLATLGLALFVALPSGGQDATLADAASEAMDVRRGTQADQDAWAAERDDLTARWRALRHETAWLAERAELEGSRTTALQDRVDELTRRMDEARRLEAGLQDSLLTVLGRLERAVAADLPFLPDERSRRLTALDRDLARPDTAPAEKLRLLLEALQVEASYGGSVETGDQRIEVAGETLTVDMLRVGRTCLFWRTPDGGRVGAWDPASRAWIELDDRHRRDISMAMDMAARLRPVEVLPLPVGRIAR